MWLLITENFSLAYKILSLANSSFNGQLLIAYNTIGCVLNFRNIMVNYLGLLSSWRREDVT